MWIVGNEHQPGIIAPTPVTTTMAPATPHLPVPQTPPPPPHVSPTPPLGQTPPSLMMGRLQGVVSLTDILNLFARVEGLKAANPNEARANRRRSSSSSTATSTSTSTTDRRR